MNFREFIKINPIRFILFTLSTAVMAALVIITCYLNQLLVNVTFARNLQQFILLIILDAISGLLIYSLQATANYLSTVQEQDLNSRVREKIIHNYYYDKKIIKLVRCKTA